MGKTLAGSIPAFVSTVYENGTSILRVPLAGEQLSPSSVPGHDFCVRDVGANE